ncbi:MAG TPA: alpha/beta hydrolase [Ktedonobacteraceae bacterium]
MAVEERVQIAIDNWEPRFLANGIDPNDFKQVTRRVEKWDDWLREWSACAAMHLALGEQAEGERCYETAGVHYLHAAMAYHFGKFVFVQNPAELRTAHQRVVASYQRGLPYFDFPGERVTIPYEKGLNMYGILRKPWHHPGPPIVILMPGLDSVKEELHEYGNDMLRRGMAVLAIDGPGQGEMEFACPLRHDYEVPIGHAIDYLESRHDLDTSRIGLLGVSLGGYFAPRATAFEKRVKAAISLAGAYDLARNFAHYPLLTREAFVYRCGAANDAEAYTKLQAFNLKGVVSQITCPLLVIMGARDRIFPVQEAQEMAAEAGANAQLWIFAEGNHVCNNIPYKHRPQQADWMRKQLAM